MQFEWCECRDDTSIVDGDQEGVKTSTLGLLTQKTINTLQILYKSNRLSEGPQYDAKEGDDCKSSWKQLKMMFEGKNQQTLQTLIKNCTITPKSQKTPRQVLDAITITTKSEDHLWHLQDELLLDVHQLHNEGIHALNISITTLINQCKFPHSIAQEMLKITILQHIIGTS